MKYFFRTWIVFKIRLPHSVTSESSRLQESVALFVCCHCAILRCDHLGDVYKNPVMDCETISESKMRHTNFR